MYISLRIMYMGYSTYIFIGTLQDKPRSLQSSPSAAQRPRKHHARPTCCEHHCREDRVRPTCCEHNRVPPCTWQARARCAAYGYCTCG